MNDTTFSAHNENVRSAARAALHARLHRTRWRIRLEAVTLAFLLALLALKPTPQPQSPIVAENRTAPPLPEEKVLLTDDELLAMFPPGACELIEVDGEKRLVFHDPAVKRQYFN